MLRIVALLAGALAGTVAAFILGAGFLRVTEQSLGGLSTNTVQLGNFGLNVIVILCALGAGVVLAAPRVGSALLLLAAGIWAAVVFLLGRVGVPVLFVPPALALLGFVLALIASFLAPRQRSESAFPSPSLRDPYDVAPSNGRYREQVATMETPSSSLGGMAERDFIPGRLNGGGGLDHRRRGRAEPEEPVFRELPEEDDEPSGFARFGRTAASILSFLLYAGAAGAVALLLFNLNQDGSNAAVVATGPSQASSSVEPAASSSRVSSSSQAPAASVASVASSSLPPPTVSSAELAPVARTAAPGPSLTDGVVVAGDTPAQPRVVGGPPPISSSEPPASTADLAAISSSELPAAAEPTEGAVDPAKVAPVPAIMSADLAARRKAGTAAPVIATPPANSDL